MGEPIIILLLLFGLASASQLPNGCPTDFSVHRLLRHETDCDKYYSCSNGQKILMTCPSNTLFDYDLQVCNHAYAVVCVSPTTELADTTTEFVAATTELADTTTESIAATTELSDTTTSIEDVLPNGCPANFSEHLLLPHEVDCDKFYSCSNGQEILFTCPGGTLFDYDLQVCNWADAVSCRTLVDDTPETFTTSSESIDVTTPVNTATSPSSIPEYTDLFTTEATTALPICPDGYFGNVPHPEMCDSYYVCTGWDPIQLFCLPGFEFDAQLQTCIEITEGGCTWLQQQRTTTEREIITDATEDIDAENTTFQPITTSETTTTQEVTITTIKAEETTSESTTEAQITTTQETSTPVATTETGAIETTTELKPTSPPVCPDGFFGSVPHPEICESYYVCTGWDPIQLFCLPGFEFDYDLQRCVEITEGGCTWQQQQHTTSESEIATESTESINTKTTTFEPTMTPEITITMTETTFTPTNEDHLTTTKETTTAEATSETEESNETENESDVVETTTELKPTSPSVCPDGFFGNVPHPEICDSYFVCTGWDPIQLYCLPGFEFDPYLEGCVEISEGGCTWSQTTTTRVTDTTLPDLSTTDSTDLKPSTILPITTEITTIDAGELNTTEPTSESTFDEFTTTDATETDETTVYPTTNSIKTDDPTTVEVTDDWKITESAITPEICPDGYFGNKPHPELCDAYYLCSGWSPILLFCSNGFEFDPEAGICVVISEGGCTWHQSSQSTTTEELTETTDVPTTSDVTVEQSTANSITETTQKITTEGSPEDINTSEPVTESTTPKVITDETTEQWTTEFTTGVPTEPIDTTANSDKTEVTSENSPTSQVTEDQSTTEITATEMVTEDDTAKETTTVRTTTEDFLITTDQDTLTNDDNTTVMTTTESPEATVELTEATTDPITTTRPICPDGFFGNVAHAERCDAYYLCSGWSPILLFCSSGYEFDPILGYCVAITEGGCTWNQTSTTYSTISSDLSTIDTTYPETVSTEMSTTSEDTDSEETANTDATELDTTIVATTERVTTPELSTEVPTTVRAVSTDETESTLEVTSEKLTTLELSTDSFTTVSVSQVTEPVTVEVSTNTETTLDDSSSTDAQQDTTTEKGVTTTEIYSTIKEVTAENISTTTPEFTTIEPLPELDVTTEEVETTTPTICPAGYFGNVPHPERCDAYYLCSGWNPILLFCPSGQEFDPDTVVCVVIDEGGCTWLQSSTTPVTAQTNTEASSSTINEGLLSSETFTTGTIEELSTTKTDFSTSENNESSTTEASDELLTTTSFTSSTVDELLTTVEDQPPEETITEQYTSSEPEYTKTSTTEFDYLTTPKTTEDTTSDVNEVEVTTTESTEIITEPTSSEDNIEYTTYISTADEIFEVTSEYWADSSTTEENDASSGTSTESTTILDSSITDVLITTEINTEENDDLETSVTTDLSTVTLESTTITTKEESTLSDLTTPENTNTVPESTVVITTTEKIITSSDSAITETELTTIETEGTTEALEVTTPAICPDGFFGMVANAAECDTYYMCSGWMPIPLRCPSGYEFDPNTEACVEITEGGCTWLSTSTVQPSTKSPLTDSTATASSNVDTTIETSKTEATDDVQSTLTTTEVFTDSTVIEDTEATESITVDHNGFAPPNPGIPDIQETEGSESTTINFVDSSTVETTTEILVTTEEVEATTQAICPDGYFGMVASAEECDLYYLCSGWMPISLRCPAGYEFSADSQACVLITEGGCTLGRMNTNSNVEVDLDTFEDDFKNNKLIVKVDIDSNSIPDSNDPKSGPNVEAVREGSIKGICEAGFYGNVKKAGSCDTFYMCVDGVAIEMNCSLGSQFDATTQKCVPVSHQRCNSAS